MSKIYEALEQAQKGQANADPGKAARGPACMQVQDIGEEMMALHCNLDTMIPKQGCRAVQFIASSEGEGTSTIAREFAKVAAEKTGDAVLLVDTDNRNPNQHDAFEIRPGNDWLESIRGNIPLEQTMARVGNGKLYVGMISRDGDLSSQLMQSPEFAAFWKSISERFDFILIDSPPLSISADGLLLSKWVDGVVLVVEAEKTRWPVVQTSRDKITGSGGNVLGVVLNKRKYYIPEYIYSRL